ncbi:MAG: 3-phosphoshikimate 1-carboxyvinyltransferase [Termitinemataceae bacterium]|nr:MAG: 3-phosphoshikimate 1-carboxyvinyltransferase [Termitinemataceae bacterium]
MDITITPHNFSLNNPLVKVPASKSHTIRMLLIASLSEGESVIRNPLKSSDAASCLSVCRALGAEITETLALDKSIEKWTVKGLGGAQNIKRQTAPLDVGNSGTTLFLGLAIASLASYPISFTGDAQIQKRSAEPLLAALEGLGVHVSSNNGCAPITVRGPWKGGLVSLECPTSQYLSALLLASPLAGEECLTEIDVPLLNEKPYIEMTLSYLQKQIPPPYNFSHFKIKGGGKYESLCASVSGDFSSAAFPSCAAVISAAKIAGNQTVEIIGLDKNDFQGDKVFFDILARCGAFVEWKENSVVLGGGDLRGGTFDLNNTPDLLPICAVLAAYCRGQTRLLNVSHARIKETDRISVMCHELKKLGVEISELRDGLVINGGKGVRGGTVDGHGDHRVVMALAVCALGAASPITILGAEAADVTYPGFLGLL